MTNFAPELFLRLMESKIVLSGTVCDDDVVRYMASRYSTTPAGIISRYMKQEGIITVCDKDECEQFCLEDNEMAILRDLGLRPSSVDFKSKE